LDKWRKIYERSVAMTVVRGEQGTVTSKVARAFPWVTGLVGLLIAVAAAMHTVLSIRKAYLQRGGYDSRLSEML
jgi:hypothetical protein